VIPAFVPALLSVLGWIGIDLGISWLTMDRSEAVYVQGMGAEEFLSSHWLLLLLYMLMAATAVAVAVPRTPNDGRGAP